MNQLKVLFLTRNLNIGGAERQLVILAKRLRQRGHSVGIGVFYSGGAFDGSLKESGVELISFNKKQRWDVISFLIKFVISLKRIKPDIIHSYLTIPNLLAILVKPLFPSTFIVWGLRSSNMDLSNYDKLSNLSYFIERKLSKYADLIISNSYVGRKYAIQNGYPENKIVVIQNGIDTNIFKFDPIGRDKIRLEWDISNNEILIGLVARIDPMKGHLIFLDAARLITDESFNIRFVLIGGGCDSYIEQIKKKATELELNHKLIWAGARNDMSSIYSALDIACSSSSFGEGFSNSIAEAMACKTPCVVTDVGDSATIVGETGVIVPAADAKALANGLIQLIIASREQRVELGEAACARIIEEFGIQKLVSNTERVLGLV